MVFSLYALTVYMTGTQRAMKDCKAGVAATDIWTWMLWYDMGDENDVGINGIYDIDVPGNNLAAKQGFVEIGLLSTDWQPIIP